MRKSLYRKFSTSCVPQDKNKRNFEYLYVKAAIKQSTRRFNRFVDKYLTV